MCLHICVCVAESASYHVRRHDIGIGELTRSPLSCKAGILTGDKIDWRCCCLLAELQRFAFGHAMVASLVRRESNPVRMNKYQARANDMDMTAFVQDCH